MSNGRNALAATLGTSPQVYSLAQLQIDAALFGARRALTTSQASAKPQETPNWLATAYHLFVSLISQLEPTTAEAQCPIVVCDPKTGKDPKGGVLTPGCSESCTSPTDFFKPPEIPAPPGCDPKDINKKLSTLTGSYKLITSPPDCHLTPAHCEALLDYKFIVFPDGSSGCIPTKCLGKPSLTSGQCRPLPIDPKKSGDPNDKTGSLGIAAAQFLVGKTPLSYTINFENLKTANAAAQEVIVTDQLDSSKVDFDTFSLGPISFGDVTVTPEPGASQYTGGVDLRPTQNLIVTIHASLDKSTGVLTWRFTSIDPGTGQLTEDPDAGFLPPDVTPPEGDGSVAFTVQAKDGLASGTQICNQASIVFDTNHPILTPNWCNTVDKTPPVSAVQSLSATQPSPNFTVQWMGSDTGSGIGDYTVFVSENGGPFSPFVSDTTETSAMFTGQTGKTYAFYSVARDLVGNVEAPPSGPDTQTIVGGLDQCPNDPSKTAPGLCRCGTPESVVGQSCTTGQPGVCNAGTKVCAGGAVSCQQNQQSSAEVCDGQDNNCNGTVDEGFNVGSSCTVGVGTCQRTGSSVCAANGQAQCSATPGTPSAEICGDGLDNDCDGVVDNGCSLPPPGDACLITTVLDTFNRADGNVGSNWRGATDPTFYRIASNRLDVQAGGPIFWNPAAFGTNQAAFVTLSTVDTKGPSQGVLLKVQSGTVPDAGAISIVYDAAAKAVRVSTLRLGALAWTSYGSTAVLFTNGDKLGACAKANGEIRVYKNDTVVKTVTLSAADQGFFNAKGGKVGVWSLLAPQAFLDNFGGATITP